MEATFVAGSFWHVEDLFGKVKGVISAEMNILEDGLRILFIRAYVQIKQAMLKQ